MHLVPTFIKEIAVQNQFHLKSPVLFTSHFPSLVYQAVPNETFNFVRRSFSFLKIDCLERKWRKDSEVGDFNGSALLEKD